LLQAVKISCRSSSNVWNSYSINREDLDWRIIFLLISSGYSYCRNIL
jgi:hypothetical protein